MAKINISFNNKNYQIDESALAPAMTALEAHLRSMAGGAEEKLEGDGSEYYTLAPTALSFRSTAPLAEFQEVQVNGATVDPSNYTLEEGSTIVKLSIDYLKTLNTGNYEVTVVSKNTTVKGNFTVAAPELNELGFYYNQPYVGEVPALDCVFIVVIRNDGKLNLITYPEMTTEICPYVLDNGVMTITSSLGEVHCTFSTAGIYCEELYTTFILNLAGCVSDGEYLYMPQTDNGVEGYMLVSVVDKNKNSYAPIRTGINGKPTIYIENYAFANITNLKEIVIPEGVFNIGANAFEGCSNLERVIFEDGSQLGAIGICAFLNCTALKSIEIPSNVVRIMSNAFNGCRNLKTVVIPNSVVEINNEAFKDCTNLSNLIFDGTVEQWNAIYFSSNAGIGDHFKNVPATHVQCSDGQVAL